VTVSHGLLLAAVHVHPVPAVTPIVRPVFASALSVNESGATEYVHPEDCEIVNVRPAIVMVPVRAADVLAATLKATVPLPVPAAPEVTVIQGADATAVQSHVVSAVTAMGVPVPPALLNDADVGANV
jgi:hypothetical protein